MELSWQRPEEDWTGVSHAKLAGWLVFYALFLLHAVTNNTGFLILDHVNLVIHEAGHFFFGWFGNTIGILGGTLGELLVPLLIAAYFFWHRDTAGTSFAAFWFFENFLYIGTYMADARSLALPLWVPVNTTGSSCSANGDCWRMTGRLAALPATSAGSGCWPPSPGSRGCRGITVIRGAAASSEGMLLEEALRRLVAESGTQFDPKVVE